MNTAKSSKSSVNTSVKPIKMLLDGFEVIEKIAVSGGNSCRVYVPKEWIGKKVRAILCSGIKVENSVGKGLKLPLKICVDGFEVVEKTVVLGGNSGRIYVPRGWVGKKVGVIRVER